MIEQTLGRRARRLDNSIDAFVFAQTSDARDEALESIVVIAARIQAIAMRELEAGGA